MKFTYTNSTNTIWTSFDCGEVEANNHHEALIKAEAELQVKLDIVNAALAANPETRGVTIEMNMDNIEVTPVKSFNHVMNFNFTVESDSEDAPNTNEIRNGLTKGIDALKNDPIELLERTVITDTVES